MFISKDINGKINIPVLEHNEMDISVSINNKMQEYKNDIIGSLKYYGKKKNIDLNGRIRNLVTEIYMRDIDGKINYKENKITNDILGKVNLKYYSYSKDILGRVVYDNKSEYNKDILGKVIYKKRGVKKDLECKLVIKEDKYEASIINGYIHSIRDSKYEYDLLGKLNIIKKNYEMIIPIKYKIKPRCMDNTILLLVFDLEGGVTKHICSRVNIVNVCNNDIMCKLNIKEKEYGKDYVGVKYYVVPYEREVYNNEILVHINDVIEMEGEEYKEDIIEGKINVMEKYENDIINCRVLLLDNEKKENDICLYYRDGYCLLSKNKIERCNEIKKEEKKCKEDDTFERECEYYEICGHCIMEYEKRLRNKRRRYKIIKSNIKNIENVVIMNNNEVKINNENNKCIKKECNEEKKENTGLMKMKIIIIVDPLWVVDPYVFKSCLITVLERYYGKCDLYITYGGNVRTDYDVMNLGLNYRINLEKLKRIEYRGNMREFIKEIMMEKEENILIGRVYIFINDPINYNNNMDIRELCNMCKREMISCVCIGSSGEYIEVLREDGMRDMREKYEIMKRKKYKNISGDNIWKYNVYDYCIGNDDPNRIVY